MKIYDFERFVEYCSMKSDKIFKGMKAKIILLICIIIGYSQRANAQQVVDDVKKIIIIDPGHGGGDSGAISEDGIQEKEIVLDIAMSMIGWNKTFLESKYDIYLTRSKDTLISLTDRTKLAKHLKPNIFISLHCNHLDDSTIQGVETYVYDTNELSLRFARIISEKLDENLGFKTRETKQANFQVLRETREYCPAILLELGYLSNYYESEYLNKRKNREVLALAILMAI